MRLPTSTRRSLSTALTVLWLAALCAGGAVLTRYGNAAGPAGAAPRTWPAESRVERAPGLPTLIVFLHPQCPCSRATVSALAELLPHAQGVVATQVLFTRPDDAPADWARGALWDSAASIPGVQCRVDEGGAEARRFGAETSGQAMLFDPAGRLLFQGGITAGRGHAGPNAGLDAIAALLAQQPPLLREAQVYGCTLF